MKYISWKVHTVLYSDFTRLYAFIQLKKTRSFFTTSSSSFCLNLLKHHTFINVIFGKKVMSFMNITTTFWCRFLKLLQLKLTFSFRLKEIMIDDKKDAFLYKWVWIILWHPVSVSDPHSGFTLCPITASTGLWAGWALPQGPARSWGSLLTHYVHLQSSVKDNNHIRAAGWATGGYSCLKQSHIARSTDLHHSHAVPCSRATCGEARCVIWLLRFMCDILLKERKNNVCNLRIIRNDMGFFWLSF